MVPLLAYCFEEGSGLTTADNSGNGHTGGLIDSPAWVAGKYGLGLRFDGNRSGQQYVSFGPDDTFDAVNQGTIMAWVKPASATGLYRNWFQSGQGGLCQWPLQLGVTNNTFDFWGGGSGCSATLDAVASIPSPVTDWHHLAFVTDGTGNKLYIDGLLSSPVYHSGNSLTQVFFAQTSTGTSKYRVGSTESPQETFDGVVDEFRIYGVALPQSEIQSAMNTPFCAGTATPTATPSGP